LDNSDRSNSQLNDRIVFKDHSKDPDQPGRKQILKKTFLGCISDKAAQITIQKWQVEMELGNISEEFVHVDSEDADPGGDVNGDPGHPAPDYGHEADPFSSLTQEEKTQLVDQQPSWRDQLKPFLSFRLP